MLTIGHKRKLLYWEGSSKKDFKEFPIGVQKDMGVALFIAQLGNTPIQPNLRRGWSRAYTNWWKTTGVIPSGPSTP
jgi:phage-related protein